MKQITLLTYSLIILFALSCQKSADLSPQNALNQIASKESTTKMTTNVLNNLYLDLDLAKVYKGESLSDKETSYAKAAVYRFYKHVQLKEGSYTTDLKEAKDINISKPLFSAILKNMNDMNLWVKKLKDDGKEVEVPQIDAKYLNTLIQ